MQTMQNDLQPRNPLAEERTIKLLGYDRAGGKSHQNWQVFQYARVELDHVLVEYFIFPIGLEPSDQTGLVVATLHLCSDTGDDMLQLGILSAGVAIVKRHQLVLRALCRAPV